ncbi:excisionase family DNA-binding protein [Kitasatospora sp. NPDC050463]|uniref:excisionase family DNA-binding protein n=1 Tax=Kitasatospora sp. NPDC050463 TaxID=3155786 RepID=UPI0033E38BFB
MPGPVDFAETAVTASISSLSSYASDEPLKVRQIAHALGVSDDTVYREIQDGRLPSYRVGRGRGLIRVQRSAFRTYLKALGIPIGLGVLTS